MTPSHDIALRALKRTEASLVSELFKVRTAIAVLEPSLAEPAGGRPRSKLELLREILLSHREGVRVKDIPALLAAMGHVNWSSHETTNWLCPSQLSPRDRFFVREQGWIKPTAEFLAENDGTSKAVLPLDTRAVDDKGTPSQETAKPKR